MERDAESQSIRAAALSHGRRLRAGGGLLESAGIQPSLGAHHLRLRHHKRILLLLDLQLLRPSASQHFNIRLHIIMLNLRRDCTDLIQVRLFGT